MSEPKSKKINLREFKVILSDRLRDPSLSPSEFTKLAILAQKIFTWKRKQRAASTEFLTRRVLEIERANAKKRNLQ